MYGVNSRNCVVYIVEPHLTGLIGTGSHPDMQNLRITALFFENSLHWQFEVKKIKHTAVLGYISIYVQTKNT
jgi:hypothetical protein